MWFIRMTIRGCRAENAEGVTTTTAKEAMFDRLQRLPDSATLEEIRDDVDTMIAIQRGLEDCRAGRVYTQEQVEEMSKSFASLPRQLAKRSF